jgi:hypothetical protein
MRFMEIVEVRLALLPPLAKIWPDNEAADGPGRCLGMAQSWILFGPGVIVGAKDKARIRISLMKMPSDRLQVVAVEGDNDEIIGCFRL